MERAATVGIRTIRKPSFVKGWVGGWELFLRDPGPPRGIEGEFPPIRHHLSDSRGTRSLGGDPCAQGSNTVTLTVLTWHKPDMQVFVPVEEGAAPD